MRKHRSLGEMISTATFLGCGVFIFLYSMELLDMGQHLRLFSHQLFRHLFTKFAMVKRNPPKIQNKAAASPI